MTTEDRDLRRRKFIARHRDALVGKIMDALVRQRGGDMLATWIRDAIDTTELRLGAMFDELIPPTAVSQNGAAQPQVKDGQAQQKRI